MFTFVVALVRAVGLFNIDSACKLKINDGRFRHQTISFLVTMFSHRPQSSTLILKWSKVTVCY